MERNFCFLLIFMDILPVKIRFSLGLNIQFLTNNTQNAECYQKYLQILQIYLDIILASLGFLHSNKRLAVVTLIVITLLELIHFKLPCIVTLVFNNEKMHNLAN